MSSSKNNFKIIEVYCDNADWVICVNEDKKSFKFKPKDKQKTSLSKASILVETDAIVSTSRWLRLEIQTHPGE